MTLSRKGVSMAQKDSSATDAGDPQAKVYESLRNYEEHFNGLQVETKKLASAWMLAVFAAIAFIVRGDLKSGSSLLDTGVLLVLIGAGANIGLLSLWILDQLVQQRLLNAAFKVGLLLERHNSNLPPIRSLMWLNSGCKGMGRYNALFYASPMAFIAAAAIYGFALADSAQWWLIAGAAIAGTAFLLPFSQWVTASRMSRRSDLSDGAKKAVAKWTERLASRPSGHF